MGKISQTGRIAQLGTPLGKDVLCLVSFNVNEGVGELFEFNVDALSEEENIDFDKAIGQACTVKLKAYGGKVRVFNGILTEAQWIGKTEDYFHYQLVLRPWFWLLGTRPTVGFFSTRTSRTLSTEVFTKAGFQRCSNSGRTATTTNIPYCVQYRETDLAFCLPV